MIFSYQHYGSIRHSMKKRRGKSTVLVYCVVLAGGLLSLECGTTTGPAIDPCQTARDLRTSPGFLTVAEEADIVARVIPGGFGSLFQDFRSSNDLVIYLKDPSKRNSAEQALLQLLTCDVVYPGWFSHLIKADVIDVRQGQYSATELLGYFHSLGQVRTDPDVWAVEVDPETDKVWIGLRSAAALSRIQQVVATIGVPAGAVSIESPPPVTGSEPFTVLDTDVPTTPHPTDNGVFRAATRLKYSNHFGETRYPDNCTTADGSQVTFLYRIEKWNGQAWRRIYDPICATIALFPRPVAPGESRTDSLPFVGVRRLLGAPVWGAARITGTYRFVGTVYLSTTPLPPYLTNPAPEEQNSTPFRIVNGLPF